MIGEKQITGKTWPNTPKQTNTNQEDFAFVSFLLFCFLTYLLPWKIEVKWHNTNYTSIFIGSVWSLMNSMKGKMLYMLENSNSLKFCIVDS